MMNNDALHIGLRGQEWLEDNEARELLSQGFQLWNGGVRLKYGCYMNHSGYFCTYNQKDSDLKGFWHVARF